MNTNRIPESFQPLVALARSAANGALKAGPAIGLTHNDAAAILTDLEMLEGRTRNPEAPEAERTIGAQIEYRLARAAHAEERRKARAASAAGREFCARSIDMLKGHLGRRWNARWLSAGFTGGSIALQEDSLPMLLSIQSYLQAHPEHENAPLEITAALAATAARQITEALSRMDEAHMVEAQAKAARDAAFRQLRRRLSALRSELAMLLEANDPRWYSFGFRRPIDGRSPEAVAEVRVAETPEGAVVAKWRPSTRAENYRVTWRIAGSDDEPRSAGLFSDPQAILKGIPAGVPVVIAVSARNRTGESATREVSIDRRES